MSLNSIALLRVLLQRAENERDTALGALRQAETLVQQAQLQARQLQDYRSEFDQRWMTRFRDSGTPELLHCHSGFGQRLSQAIVVQDNNASQLGNRVQRARELLLAREQRVAAVRKLIERREADLQKIAAQRDQRNTDDAAQRAHGAAQRGQPCPN
jgi:flagellar FliJ protein